MGDTRLVSAAGDTLVSFPNQSGTTEECASLPRLVIGGKVVLCWDDPEEVRELARQLLTMAATMPG